ncbi:hypothetical protein bpmyx0001_45420 [Bacillus pseudomycoides DSM 12442]|nr:hypothetical protein bpmyx0001_45420 [Bacillus pseudomycoides DSM 12442]
MRFLYVTSYILVLIFSHTVRGKGIYNNFRIKFKGFKPIST